MTLITSAKQSAWASDVAIDDLAAAGLAVPCVVRMKLFTLEVGLVARRAGRLGAGDVVEVRAVVDGIVIAD